MIYPISLYVFPAVLLLIVVRKYRERKWGKCTNQVKLNGKVVLVTGANSGIGLEIAKELAARNAKVILACRSLEKAKLAEEKIRKSLFNDPQLVPMSVDIGSLHSVESFAQQVKKEFSQIDILINNAGVAYPKSQILQTEDGFEIHFGTNHLGHFYLTNLLEDLVAKAQGRIVIVSSTLHEKGKLDLNAIKNLEFEEKENLYANSKLANVYFAQEFSRRTNNKGIKVYAMCPGLVNTGLFRHAVKWYHYILAAPIVYFLMRSANQVPMSVDIGSLHSVESFAQDVRKRFSQIDILINNAGVAYPKSQILQTVDGFEIHFGTNHLGHFYLTNLLEDLVTKAQGRIVVVSSSLHEKGKLDLKAIKNLKFEDKENLYANSKLANVYFAQELSERTKNKGIKVYAMCPGWVYTGLFRHSVKWYHYILIAPIAYLFMRSAKQGAQTAVYCATEPSLEKETGLLYRDCKKYNSKAIFYDSIRVELWKESDEMITGVMKIN